MRRRRIHAPTAMTHCGNDTEANTRNNTQHSANNRHSKQLPNPTNNKRDRQTGDRRGGGEGGRGIDTPCPRHPHSGPARPSTTGTHSPAHTHLNTVRTRRKPPPKPAAKKTQLHTRPPAVRVAGARRGAARTGSGVRAVDEGGLNPPAGHASRRQQPRRGSTGPCTTARWAGEWGESVPKKFWAGFGFSTLDPDNALNTLRQFCTGV